MSDEKAFEIDENIPVVNSWDEDAGNSKAKTLVKTMSNQNYNEDVNEKKEEERVPFSSPSIDFTTVIPIINENTILEEETKIKPIIFENNEPKAVISLEENKEEVKEIPIEVKKIEEIPVKEEIPTPIIDIPQTSILSFDNLINQENIPVKEEINIPKEVVSEIKDITPIEIAEPIKKEFNPQKDIINKINIDQNILNKTQEDTLDSSNTEEIDTMTSKELNQNFASVINENNDQPTNEMDTISSNTFTNIFDKDQLEKTPIDPEIASKVFKENEIRTPLDTTTLNAKRKVVVKKHIIPPSFRLGVLIFVIMFAYILNIDQITNFINEIIYKLG